MLVRTLLLTLTLLGPAGCASLLPDPHKIEVQQGTVIDPEKVDQLRTGMSREQVRYLLGNPTLTDIFHPDRWDYLHYRTLAGEDAPVSRLTLFFDGDRLVRIDDRRLAEEPAPPSSATPAASD